MKNKFRILNRILCLLIICTLLLSGFGCAGKGSSKASVDADAEPVRISSDKLNVHYASPQLFNEIAASGLITLLFDENSSAIGVRINDGSDNGKIWSALPVLEENGISDEAKIVTLEIVHNDTRYFLNSQDNSVAVNCAFWESIKNGFRVVYFITDSPEKISGIGAGAADEAYASAIGDGILFKTEVIYELKDGCLYANLNWTNLGDNNDILVNISFLDYFGANTASAQGDFILVPDGCGALIDVASTAAFEPFNLPVYGGDLTDSALSGAVVPAYGMKSGDAAFATVIEKGDAIATVNAAKFNNSSNFNRVGASFAVTPSQLDDERIIYSKISYSGELSLSFRFLNGSDATYAGLAAACREQLVRNYTLSTGSVENSEYMPIFVNVIGRAKREGFFALPKTLTTFDEAHDLLTRIKSKGINNVYLRYSGAMSGGLEARNASNADILKILGGKSALRELNDYAATLNFNLFMDVALLSDSSSSKATVGNLVSSKASFEYDNIFKSTGFVSEPSKRYVMGVGSLEKTVLSVLENFDNLDSTGFCVTDAGSYLYTDYITQADRQSVRDTVSLTLQPLATQSLLMVEKGNFYSLKNADVISGIPVSTSRNVGEGYTAVPFVQIILHGIVEYSGMPVNASDDNVLAFLRCVEYGMLPNFVLTNDSFVDSKEYSAIFNIDNWLNTMYSNYMRFTQVMGDLRSSRITNHYMVSEGVYCTEFESTTRIYVNYTNEAVTVSGITVEPLDYFRVN